MLHLKSESTLSKALISNDNAVKKFALNFLLP